MPSSPPPRQTDTCDICDVCIVGTGFAGASTAASLVARGVRSIVLVEAEAIPGYHGSGRNAAMARRLIGDPVLTRLAVESVARIVALEQEGRARLLNPTGGLIVGREADLGALETIGRADEALAQEITRLDSAALAERVPALRGASCEVGIFTGGCGVVDIHALLTTYLDLARAGGASVRFGTTATGVTRSGARVTGVETTAGPISCGTVVDAAGFSANALAESAGLPPLPLDPVRRHLFVSAAIEEVDSRWPFVWDVSGELYFRPEGTGLLMCACDGTSWPPSEPPTDPAERERLAEKFSRHVPALAGARLRRGWAGLRVLTPDGRFVIGPSAELEGFFWVAGLGGHGMTTSAGVGELAAAGIVDGALPARFRAAFDPARFTRDQGQSSSQT